MKKLSAFAFALLIMLTFSSCASKNREHYITTEESISVSGVCGASKNEASTAPDKIPEETHVFTDTKNFSKSKADNICNIYNASGVQAAVIKNGELYTTYEFGSQNIEAGVKISADTKFRIASLSKLVTDTVFMCLKDDGLISDKTDINAYLGYSVRNPHYPDIPITPEMLMTHTSSIIDSEKFLSSRFSGSSVPLKTLLTSPNSFSSACPGKSFVYSNLSVAVVGACCEAVTRKCFNDLAENYLFSPLGIDASYIASGIKAQDKIAALYGNGGLTVAQQMSENFSLLPAQTHHLVQGNLTISAKDYTKIITMLCKNGIADNGKKILSEESAASVLASHFYTGNYGVGYGVLLQNNVIGSKKLCVHTGSNFGMFSAFAFSPETGDGVVVLTSGANGEKDKATNIYKICYDLIRLFYPSN